MDKESLRLLYHVGIFEHFDFKHAGCVLYRVACTLVVQLNDARGLINAITQITHATEDSRAFNAGQNTSIELKLIGELDRNDAASSDWYRYLEADMKFRELLNSCGVGPYHGISYFCCLLWLEHCISTIDQTVHDRLAARQNFLDTLKSDNFERYSTLRDWVA